eukprot:315399-Rhodomonas_salina.1
MTPRFCTGESVLYWVFRYSCTCFSLLAAGLYCVSRCGCTECGSCWYQREAIKSQIAHFGQTPRQVPSFYLAPT